MKVLCVSEQEVVLKSDNSLLSDGEAFYLPEDCETEGVVFSVGIAVRIKQICKSVPAKLASKYYEQVCFAFDFRKKEQSGDALQNAFDYSFAIGKKVNFCEIKSLSFTLRKGESQVLQLSLSELESKIDNSMQRVSETMSLKVGDMLFVPLCDKAFEANAGDEYEICSDETCFLSCKIK